MCMRACMCVYVCAFARASVYTGMRACMCAYVRACGDSCMHPCVRESVHLLPASAPPLKPSVGLACTLGQPCLYSNSGASAAAGVWLPAACKHIAVLLPGGVCTLVAAALHLCFFLGEA